MEKLGSGTEVNLQLLEKHGCEFLIVAYQAFMAGKLDAACYACNAKFSRRDDVVIFQGDCLARARTGEGS